MAAPRWRSCPPRSGSSPASSARAAADAAAIAAARPLLTAAQLPLLNRVARQVVGRKTIDLIDSRLRPAAPDPAVELGLRQAA